MSLQNNNISISVLITVINLCCCNFSKIFTGRCKRLCYCLAWRLHI